MTPKFQKRLKALEDHPLVGEAVGRGLIGGGYFCGVAAPAFPCSSITSTFSLN